MTEARIEANRRRGNADVIYGIGFILLGAPILAAVLTWVI